MSINYTNPLDKFASYSTHFVLLAARSTERVRAFLQNDSATRQATLDAIDRVQRLGDPVQYEGTGSEVFLALDTRRFSHFSISDLRFEVLVNGLMNNQAHSSFATSLSMTVVDNAGISFFNYLQWLMDSQLQTNFDGMLFLLRTLFVGHLPNGTTELVQAVTIPMMLFNLELDLSDTRGTYTCEFMPTINFSHGPGSRWINIGTATNFFTGEGNNTLGAVIDSFQNRLNKESEDRYNALNEAIAVTRAGEPLATPNGKFGRIVRYQVTVPTSWREFTFTGRSINAAEEKDHTKQNVDEDKSPTPAKDAHVAADSGMTIPQVLDLILRQVKDISDYANFEKLQGNDRIVKFYKHLVYVTSNDDEFVVHVDVIPFEVPDAVPSKDNSQKAVSKHMSDFYVYDEATRTRRPKNYFELDYIFTGKNIDVLSFEMKMQSLQFLLAANVRVSEGDMYSVVQKGQGGTQDGKRPVDQKDQEILSSRPFDPMLIPLLTKAQSSGFSQFAKSRSNEVTRETTKSFQAYIKNLSAFYAASPITVNATIRGNPELMAKFNVGTIMPHSSVIENTGQGQTFIEALRKYEEELKQKILDTNELEITSSGAYRSKLGSSSYMKSPVFVKVNVRGPNVDFRTNGPMRDPTTQMPIAGQDFSSEVLVDNYYTVMKITSNIQQGNFTQDLELWVHNVFGYSSPMEQSAVTAKPIKSRG